MGTRKKPRNETVKILWAIDAFHEAPKEQLRATKAIQALFSDMQVQVQPVAVISSGKFDTETNSFLETWPELARGTAHHLENILKGANVTGLVAPQMIRANGNSVSETVKNFLAYATQESADYIVVSSHGRKGVSRFVMGSFSESLVLQSPIPVLVVNPNTQISAKAKTILFPTDFSEKSQLAFDKVLPMARKKGCKILLFHKVEYFYPEVAYPFSVPPISKEAVKEMENRWKEKAAFWIEYAEKRGVTTKVHLCTKGGYVLDEIIRVAKKLGTGTFIAMASQSGTVATLLLGSLTRQVLRHAPCPVLVIHPESDTLVKKTIEEFKNVALTYGYRPVIG